MSSDGEISSFRRESCRWQVGMGITIVATRTKLIGLGGRPMTVDTGDPETDQMLSGYYRVVTGYQDYIPYKIVL